MPVHDEFVLDCSFISAWRFDDEATPYAIGVRDGLVDKRAAVDGRRRRRAIQPTLNSVGIADNRRELTDPAAMGKGSKRDQGSDPFGSIGIGTTPACRRDPINILCISAP